MRAWMMEVKDDTTQSWLKWRLHDYQGYHHHHLLEKAEYWLGATDLQWEKHWKWDNSNTYASYFKWLPSEPNNYLDHQNCLAVRQRCPDDADCIDYGWFDDDCYQKKFYICETKGILRGVPTTKAPRLEEKNVDTA
ncbi:hypothetical protein NP493_595g01030 [Ridgeia piscesae]|uniref:C-type lectin domain-containing protein n=1 Tax=Ridgeia piscesae TaxID=27915 RepID=A0AAD9NPE2_RIDPI|nr:hypothetical protein NP493_595g01030 [Ridgeia piscesae]